MQEDPTEQRAKKEPLAAALLLFLGSQGWLSACIPDRALRALPVKVTRSTGFPRRPLVHACCPSLFGHRIPFQPQKNPILGNTLNGHSTKYP